MRRDLGPSFRMVRIGWTMLAASLAAAFGVALDVPFDGMPTLFGLLLTPVFYWIAQRLTAAYRSRYHGRVALEHTGAPLALPREAQ